MNKNKLPRNANGQEHGIWEVYWSSNQLWFRTVYSNGKKNGFEEWYNFDGKLSTKTYYL